MTNHLPFFVSDEAMEWLLSLPNYTDREPGFVSSPCFGVFRGSLLIEEFVGDHFSFTFSPPHEWRGNRDAAAFVIGRRPFWLSSDTISKLAGKTLGVVEVDVAVGGSPVSIRKFLVPFEDQPTASSAANCRPAGKVDSSENLLATNHFDQAFPAAVGELDRST